MAVTQPSAHRRAIRVYAASLVTFSAHR